MTAKPVPVADKDKKYQYDPVAIAALMAPLTLRVERIRGTNRTPINVPSPGGEGFNSGFTAEHLEGLEAWLRDRGAGGGLYSITVYDQQNVKFEWRPWFDPRLHREIVPGDSTNILVEQPPPQLPPQQFVMMTPSGPVTVQAPTPAPTAPPPPTLQQPQTFAALPWPPPQPQPAQPQPQQVSAPMSIPYNPYFMQPVPAPTSVPSSGGSSDYERRTQAEAMERLKAELAETKRAQIEAAYKADLEKQRLEFARQVEDLKRAQTAAPAVDPAVAELKALVAQLLQKPAVDPAVAELKEQLRRTEERAERDRDRADLKEQLRQSEAATAAQVAAMSAQLTAAAQVRGPDPMLEVMRENARTQLEMVRDINRSSQVSADAMRALIKDSSSGVDVATKSMLGNFGAMFDMQQRLVDYAMQATSSSEGPIVSTIKEGINAAKEYGERYAINKRQEAQATAGAQAATAEAARAASVERTVQMEQMARREAELAEHEQAAREGRATQRQVNQAAHAHRGAFTPDAPAAQPGLAGAGAGATPTATNEHGQTVAAPVQVKRKGKTDAEWFGDAMVEVDRLRFGAAAFVESASVDPPRTDKKTGQIIGLTPPQTVDYLLRAVDVVVKNDMNIPAFRVLFMQEAYADFFDVLLPNVPQLYRDDCAQALYTHMRSGAGHTITNAAPAGSDAAAATATAAAIAAAPALVDDEEEEEEKDDGDGDDDGDDDAHDGKPHANGATAVAPTAPPPTVVKPGIARRVTRA